MDTPPKAVELHRRPAEDELSPTGIVLAVTAFDVTRNCEKTINEYGEVWLNVFAGSSAKGDSDKLWPYVAVFREVSPGVWEYSGCKPPKPQRSRSVGEHKLCCWQFQVSPGNRADCTGWNKYEEYERQR